MSRAGSISTPIRRGRHRRAQERRPPNTMPAATVIPSMRHRRMCCDGADVSPSWLTLAPFNLIFVDLIWFDLIYIELKFKFRFGYEFRFRFIFSLKFVSELKFRFKFRFHLVRIWICILISSTSDYRLSLTSTNSRVGTSDSRRSRPPTPESELLIRTRTHRFPPDSLDYRQTRSSPTGLPLHSQHPPDSRVLALGGIERIGQTSSISSLES
jgi:hypothetical protein